MPTVAMMPAVRPMACHLDLRQILTAVMPVARLMVRLPVRLRASNQILFE